MKLLKKYQSFTNLLNTSNLIKENDEYSEAQQQKQKGSESLGYDPNSLEKFNRVNLGNLKGKKSKMVIMKKIGKGEINEQPNLRIFHRTKDANINLIGRDGFRTGPRNAWGEGIYCVYDMISTTVENEYNAGHKRWMDYGKTMIENRVMSLRDYLIFDYDVAIKVYGKDNYKLIDQCKIVLPEPIFEKYKEIIQQASDRCEELSKATPKNKYTTEVLEKIIFIPEIKDILRGIIFTGQWDGKVLLSYDRENVAPMRFSYDDGQTWTKFTEETGYQKSKNNLKKLLKDKGVEYLYTKIEDKLKNYLNSRFGATFDPSKLSDDEIIEKSKILNIAWNERFGHISDTIHELKEKEDEKSQDYLKKLEEVVKRVKVFLGDSDNKIKSKLASIKNDENYLVEVLKKLQPLLDDESSKSDGNWYFSIFTEFRILLGKFKVNLLDSSEKQIINLYEYLFEKFKKTEILLSRNLTNMDAIRVELYPDSYIKKEKKIFLKKTIENLKKKCLEHSKIKVRKIFDDKLSDIKDEKFFSELYILGYFGRSLSNFFDFLETDEIVSKKIKDLFETKREIAISALDKLLRENALGDKSGTSNVLKNTFLKYYIDDIFKYRDKNLLKIIQEYLPAFVKNPYSGMSRCMNDILDDDDKQDLRNLRIFVNYVKKSEFYDYFKNNQLENIDSIFYEFIDHHYSVYSPEMKAKVNKLLKEINVDLKFGIFKRKIEDLLSTEKIDNVIIGAIKATFEDNINSFEHFIKKFENIIKKEIKIESEKNFKIEQDHYGNYPDSYGKLYNINSIAIKYDFEVIQPNKEILLLSLLDKETLDKFMEGITIPRTIYNRILLYPLKFRSDYKQKDNTLVLEIINKRIELLKNKIDFFTSEENKNFLLSHLTMLEIFNISYNFKEKGEDISYWNEIINEFLFYKIRIENILGVEDPENSSERQKIYIEYISKYKPDFSKFIDKYDISTKVSGENLKFLPKDFFYKWFYENAKISSKRYTKELLEKNEFDIKIFLNKYGDNSETENIIKDLVVSKILKINDITDYLKDKKYFKEVLYQTKLINVLEKGDTEEIKAYINFGKQLGVEADRVESYLKIGDLELKDVFKDLNSDIITELIRNKIYTLDAIISFFSNRFIFRDDLAEKLIDNFPDSNDFFEIKEITKNPELLKRLREKTDISKLNIAKRFDYLLGVGYSDLDNTIEFVNKNYQKDKDVNVRSSVLLCLLIFSENKQQAINKFDKVVFDEFLKDFSNIIIDKSKNLEKDEILFDFTKSSFESDSFNKFLTHKNMTETIKSLLKYVDNIESKKILEDELKKLSTKNERIILNYKNFVKLRS